MAPPEIIGRKHELESIEGFVARLEEGPSALVLAGEPGSGKTVLWREAVARAEERGCVVLRSQGAESEAALSFAGLADLFGPVLDDVLPALPSPQRRALEGALLRVDPGRKIDRLALSLAAHGGVLALARESGVLIAVDDLQWLDEPSAGVLAFLLRRLESEPVALLASGRLEQSAALLLQLERAFPPDRLTRVSVEPLGLMEIGRLLRTRLGLALPRPALRQVFELSGGNPLYALEIGRTVPSATSLAPGEPLVLPASLADLVTRRLEELPEGARELVLAVAAMSTPSLSVVERLDADALEEALGAGALELEGTRVRFTHPLLGSTAYALASPARRRRLHRELAQIVEDPEERVLHRALGCEGSDASVALALEETAAGASARGAPETASGLVARAVALTPPYDRADAVRRRLLTADYLFQAGDGERARAVLDELLASLPAGRERAEALQRLAWITADAESAIQLAEQALAEAGDDPALRAQIHTKLARLTAIGGDERAVEHAQAAHELAEESGEVDILARAMGERLRRHLFSGGGLDRPLADRALELRPEAGRLSAYESPERSVGAILSMIDQVEEARPLLEGSLQRAVDGGEIEGELGVLLHLAELEIRAGRWLLADDYIRRNIEVERFSGLPDLAYALGILAHVSALLGRVEEARQAGEEGSALATETGQRIFRMMNEYALGFLELSLGNAEAAARRLVPLSDEQLSIGIRDPTIFPVLPDAIEALIGAGDLELAETYVERLEADGRRLDRPLALSAAARGRALLAEAAGKSADALESIERALAEVERLGSAFQLGRTLLVEGRIHRRERRKGKAKARLEEALAEFERLGAALWAERTREELGRVGLRRADASGLTETEGRVAELVAAGRTNREVAAELFLSVKTVEVYLTRIYRKHGVRSRTQLAHALREPNQAPD